MNAAEKLAAEVAEWRRVHTWGGYLWPEPVDPRWQRSEDLLDEVQWQLDMGEAPFFAARVVGMKPASLQRLAYRHGRQGLVKAFEEETKLERTAA